jgi:transcriptional regulator with XRE-family HTH domain
MTFGEAVSSARKKLGISQKDLASKIRKEDGSPISAQYLNDIEHDRRNAPGEEMIRQFATELKMEFEYLMFIAGSIPSEIAELRTSPEKVAQAFRAFRRTLK